MKRMLLLLILLNCVVMAQDDIYVLCEGNMGSNNASLWQFDETSTTAAGPIYWSTQNPLGDIGQSLTIHDNYLYIVLNGSNNIEVMDISGLEPAYVKTIEVTNGGPREVVIYNDKAYISTYYSGILEYDLGTDTFTDTVAINGMADCLELKDNNLFVAINMQSDWSSDSTIVAIDLDASELAINKTYTVVLGPGNMTTLGDSLFVISTYYDASWFAWTGTSKINLSTGEVTKLVHGVTTAYSSDIVFYNNQIYRTLDSLVVPLDKDINPVIDAAIAEVPTGTIYSMSIYDNKVFIGYTDDYVAPDYVSIFDTEGNLEKTVNVSASPGDLAFYTAGNSIHSYTGQSTIAEKPQITCSYPNPFNPQTTIQFYLPKTAVVKLSVFNIRGEKVKELTNSQFAQGYHTVTWNAAEMASGTYFVRMQSGSTMEMHKVLLLK